MLFMIAITIVIIIISFYKDRKKTIKGLKTAFKKGINIIIPLLTVLIFASLILFFYLQILSRGIYQKEISTATWYLHHFLDRLR